MTSGTLDRGLVLTNTNGRSPVKAYGPASASNFSFWLGRAASSASTGVNWFACCPAKSRDKDNPVGAEIRDSLLLNTTAPTTAKTARSAAIASGPACDQKASP